MEDQDNENKNENETDTNFQVKLRKEVSLDNIIGNTQNSNSHTSFPGSHSFQIVKTQSSTVSNNNENNKTDITERIFENISQYHAHLEVVKGRGREFGGDLKDLGDYAGEICRIGVEF